MSSFGLLRNRFLIQQLNLREDPEVGFYVLMFLDSCGSLGCFLKAVGRSMPVMCAYYYRNA